ncbi:MFS general substrate transporter [Mytilinidion resinicola]|uniref:MFS general substrate transporter n=1 Tax=Mytilinidion resinicola TaxID=574789 RepID=A0A6A6YHJ5_9PEZI|nr:MFS general substrate transporter [Mytilinidion resinicola]KAF2808230.1 MFS general substrate transporter [Mytilinidion resinicola]
MHGIPAPTAVELDDFNWGNRYNGPRSGTQTPFGEPGEPSTPMSPITPKSPNELEMSRPPSPKRDEAASLVQTFWNPPMNKWRVLSCCLTYFGNGMNDSAPGALIPYMETDYRIGYAIVSMIFVGNALGFIVAAFFANWFLYKLGRAKTLMLSELFLIAANVIIVTTPPFPVVVISFFLLGYGAAINLALNNVFCANLHPSSVILGAAHGSYGIGGTIAPIIATTLVTHGSVWSRFYFVVLGIRVLCLAFAAFSFWHYEEEAPARLLAALEQTASRQIAAEAGELTKTQLMKQALKNRVTIGGAVFIFAYQGAEVSVSGWVISFLISYRGGDPARVGYVTSGFWAGITVGRFVLTHAAPKIGERPFVVALTLGSIAFQLLVWLVPNVIGEAVAVGILGLLIGPIYPCGQTVFTRLLPRDLQTTSVAFMSSAGSSGGAVAPLVTGLVSQAAGTFVLNPICIGLYVVMIICWMLLPKVRKRTE